MMNDKSQGGAHV